ncbi:MAG: hypothetical protein IPJ54_21060 [Saprospiraceae bacterium]|nr:hypothetical protein [Saprospiraceae bacterium]
MNSYHQHHSKEANFSEILFNQIILNYGKYMIIVAGCMDCHTKQVRGEVGGEPYAGVILNL